MLWILSSSIRATSLRIILGMTVFPEVSDDARFNHVVESTLRCHNSSKGGTLSHPVISLITCTQSFIGNLINQVNLVLSPINSLFVNNNLYWM